MPSLEPVDHDPFASSGGVVLTPGENGGPSRLIMNMGGPKLEPVDHDPFATDYGAVAKDVAKSAGVGVGKGVIALGGMVGDLTNLGAKGLEKADKYISEKIGAEPYHRPEGPSALDNIPTSESLTNNVKGVTGEFYQPQTTAGHYAETVGEFVPAALAGPGGMARKIALGAVLPGVASEAAGEATAGTPIEPFARAAGGVVGGLGGALASRPSSTAAAIQSQLPAGITQAVVDDARSLMLNAKAKGISLTWPEALSQSAGRPVLSDTQRILESAPGSRTRMQDFHAERPQQFDQAALNEFDQIAPGTRNPSQIGPQISRAADQSIGDVRKSINAAAEPYYQAAESVTLSPAEMSHVRAIPNWTEARDAVRNGPNAWRVKHLPDASVGFLNEVKKEFDQLAENSASKFNPQKNKSTQDTYEKAASAVKQIGEAKSADYQIALGIQQQAREKYLQPLLDGPLGRLAKKDVTTQRAIDALFPSNPLPNSHNEIHDAVSRLAAKNPGAATQLVRAHMESTFNEATRALQSGANQFGAAGFAKKLVGNAQQRANLQAAVEALPNGKQIWQGVDNFLEAAEATGTRQAKGSLTAFNAAEMKGMSGSGLVGEAVKTGLSPGKWWSVVSDKWSQWKLGKNLDELARIFTDPNSAPVLKRIVAMPKGSREAGYLVSRLILQAEDTAVQPREPRRQ
jgi:DNA-binding GntR family transcriptional regulator